MTDRVPESSSPDPLDRAHTVLRRHLLATGTLMIAVVVAMLLAEWWLTRQEADRAAEQVTARVTESVSEILIGTDFGDSAQSHAQLDARLGGFFVAGAIVRIKVWLVEGDRVRVVYSDDPRIEGTTRDFSAALAQRLNAGETVVLPVPADAEHRLETAMETELREAFVGFTDRAGNEMRLEVYVPVHSQAISGRALWVQIPVILGGLVALVLVLARGSTSLVRQLRLLSQERQDAVLFGLGAAEVERIRLAERLHDGVVQSLSGSRLALASVQGRSAADGAALTRVIDILGEDATVLRGMLAEFGAGSVTPGSLPAELLALAAPDSYPAVEVAVGDSLTEDLAEPDATVLVRTATEAVRNARLHADADRILVRATRSGGGVELVVRDDGRGLAPERARSAVAEGHFGLALARRAIVGAGGRFEIGPGEQTGTELRAWLPSRTARAASAGTSPPPQQGSGPQRT